MTRWKDDDLVGRILEEQKTAGGIPWEIITLPAIAEEDETFRKEGEALWADYYTLENLEQTKADIGFYEFNSQYQQNPVSRETQIFKPEMFKHIPMEDVLHKVTNCYVTIDTQGKQKATKKSDFTGITINWVDSDNIWYLKSYHKKISESELFELIFELHQAYKPVAIGIEKTMFVDAIQPFLNVEMGKRNIFPNVVELSHGGTNKETRIKWLEPRYNRGYIYHIEGQCIDLEAELLRFPASKHDDTMDSAAYQTQIAEAMDNSFDWDAFADEELAPTVKMNPDINV
jgi:phage terminase large subunit-like protein